MNSKEILECFEEAVNRLATIQMQREELERRGRQILILTQELNKMYQINQRLQQSLREFQVSTELPPLEKKVSVKEKTFTN